MWCRLVVVGPFWLGFFWQGGEEALCQFLFSFFLCRMRQFLPIFPSSHSLSLLPGNFCFAICSLFLFSPLCLCLSAGCMGGGDGEERRRYRMRGAIRGGGGRRGGGRGGGSGDVGLHRLLACYPRCLALLLLPFPPLPPPLLFWSFGSARKEGRTKRMATEVWKRRKFHFFPNFHNAFIHDAM